MKERPCVQGDRGEKGRFRRRVGLNSSQQFSPTSLFAIPVVQVSFLTYQFKSPLLEDAGSCFFLIPVGLDITG